MELQYLIVLLKRNLWLILSLPIISVTAAVIFLNQSDETFKSTAQIATGITIEDQRLSDDINPYEAGNKFNNLIETINSSLVVSLVSYELLLHDLKNEKPFRVIEENDKVDISLIIRDVDKYSTITERKLEEFKPLDYYNLDENYIARVLELYEYDHKSLIENMRIKRLGSSDYIVFEFESEDPFLSSFTVNAMCDQFILYNKTIEADRSGQSIAYFADLVAEKKAILEVNTELLNSYKRINNVINYTSETESRITQVTQYEINKEKEQKSLNSLRLELSNINNKLQQYSSKSQTNISETNGKILSLRKKINELNIIYISNGSKDKEVKKTMDNLRDQLQYQLALISSLQNSSQEDIVELEKQKDYFSLQIKITESNLKSINNTLQELRARVSGFAAKEARILAFERDVQAASEEYLNAQEKFNTSKTTSLLAGSNIRKIIAGQPSDKPEQSKALIIIALSGITSIILALLFIISSDYLDVKIRTPQRLEKFTKTHVLGSIILAKFKNLNLQNIFKSQKVSKDHEVLKQYLRKIRVEIQNSGSKVFLITSTKENAGKSFFITSISYVLSLVGRKVLIIDTNFKNNSLTRNLIPKTKSKILLKRGVESELKPLYENEINEENNFISKTSWTGVDIIGNFGGVDSPSEILGTRDFMKLINSFSREYDYVFLEGSSLNDYSDSKELVEFVDKVVVIFSADSMIKNLDKDSIKYLISLKSKLLGSILNKVQIKDFSA